MPRRLRIVALVDPDLVPPDSIKGLSDEEMADWKMEFDVCSTAEELGHDVFRLGLEDVSQLAEVQQDFQPHVVFNMLEEFHGTAAYEPFVVCHLELLKLCYTGCNPQGLMLAHHKPLSKQLMRAAGIPTPNGCVVPLNADVPTSAEELRFPLLVKSALEDASLGITLDSVVHTHRELKQQVRAIHREFESDAIVEEYIEGREFYVGTLGNKRCQALPVWELLFRRLPAGTPNIATADVKWDYALQKRLGVHTKLADIPHPLSRRLQRIARQVHQTLGLSGYARMDFRVSEDGQPFVLEANPNPNLCYGEDLAESAEVAGIDYESLIQKIINLGLNYPAPWKATS